MHSVLTCFSKNQPLLSACAVVADFFRLLCMDTEMPRPPPPLPLAFEVLLLNECVLTDLSRP